MLDIGYTHEWIRYLMDIFGVPKQFPRPKEGSKYIFCKELFAELREDETTKEIIVEIAMYIVESERFDRNLQPDGLKHLPVFKSIIKKAGFKTPEDISMRVTPIFQGRNFKLDSRLCFILMPFKLEWSNRVYDKVLKPILSKFGLEPKRANDLFGQDIMEDIWFGINSAFIVIADVTGRNANVFYELGIAHTLDKNIIILTQNEGDVPFDISRYRYINYADNIDGYELLEELLPKFIGEFYSPHHENYID